MSDSHSNNSNTIKYVSCSDTNETKQKKRYTFEEAVFSGWASDGGMIVPENIPTVDTHTLREWAKLKYPELCYEILRLFISEKEIPSHELKHIIVENSFKRFEHENVVNVEKNILSAGNNNTNPNRSIGKIHIVELWHGPTLAFKDLGLQVRT